MSVSGILLAAGQSRRFGARTKQLLDFGGEPLIRRVARAACESRLDEIVIVLGHSASRIEAALAGLEVRIVHNPRYKEGLSRSIQAGISKLDQQAEAALFLTADQPFLSTETIDRIVDAYRNTELPIVVPCFKGRRGSPVLFDGSLFPRLLQLKGDEGGREVIRRHPELVQTVELKSGLALSDMDTPADYEGLLGYTRDMGENSE